MKSLISSCSDHPCPPNNTAANISNMMLLDPGPVAALQTNLHYF